jgi:ABC-type dipeptide/oligopeptide/nickel transport system permease subunit
METLRKILKRKTSLIGAVILLIFFLTALVGPFLCAYDPLMTDPENKYAQPSGAHVLGTDYLGRDVFTRMVYGARVSLSISFIGVLSGAFIGIILGLLAGYYGKWIDTLISRFIDILLAFPGLLLAIMIVAILGKGIENTVIAVSVFSVPSIARLIRGLVISLRESEYLQACKVMGASDYRIIFHHILPNTHVTDDRQHHPQPGHRHPDSLLPFLSGPGRSAPQPGMGCHAVRSPRSHPHLPDGFHCSRGHDYIGGTVLQHGGRRPAGRAGS